jgi:predicted nuclease of predicted toxin-antitoxin system
MTVRLLIDECLSPQLVQLAVDRGVECTCVRDRGLLGATDRKLVNFLTEEDFTLVTENAVDFRTLFGVEELHAGLVCLNSKRHMDLATQQELFRTALDALGEDLVNQVLEVSENEEGEITVSTYEHAASPDT